jgi:hypothetical protein
MRTQASTIRTFIATLLHAAPEGLGKLDRVANVRPIRPHPEGRVILDPHSTPRAGMGLLLQERHDDWDPSPDGRTFVQFDPAVLVDAPDRSHKRPPEPRTPQDYAVTGFRATLPAGNN